MDATEPDRRLAVVMITYNRVDETLRTLGRLAALPEAPRVVVVDNGSTDGTAAAVAERFPQFELIRSETNLGGAGRTLGVNRVEEPYVAFCDDDTWWDPGHLRRAADLFDAHPRLAIVTARVLVGPENREDPACRILATSPLPRVEGMPGPSLLGFLAGASMLRRAAYLEAGGFDPRMQVGGEEEDLAATLVARGWWLCYVPELTVHHYPSAQRDPYVRQWRGVRNALWFTWRRRPLSSALRRTLQITRRAPHARAAVRGLAAAIAGLPWIVRHRRVVPPEVERLYRLLDSMVEGGG